MASPKTPALLTLAAQNVHLKPGGPESQLSLSPSRFSPTQSSPKFYTFMSGNGKRWQRTIRLLKKKERAFSYLFFVLHNNKSHATQCLSHHRPIKLMNGGFWCVPIELQCFTVTTAPLIIFSSLCTVAIKRSGFLESRKWTFFCSLWVFSSLSVNCFLFLCYFLLLFLSPNFSKACCIWLTGVRLEGGWDIVVESVFCMPALDEGSSFSCGCKNCSSVFKWIQFTCAAVFTFPHRTESTRVCRMKINVYIKKINKIRWNVGALRITVMVLCYVWLCYFLCYMF